MRLLNVATACQILADGEVLAYPTESVWGLGVDACNQGACDRLWRIKSRPKNKPCLVLSTQALCEKSLLKLPKTAQARINTPSARPITWLVPADIFITTPCFSPALLAVRLVDFVPLVRLCHALASAHNPHGFLVSTSCNKAGEPPAQDLPTAMAYFGNRVHYLNQNKDPNSANKKPSQIINALTGQVIRP